MESLLRWSIEHSHPNRGDAPPPAPRQDLDTGIIDYILGKPDAQLMKEALEVAVDTSKDDDMRIAAMDDLEMLVENIDNANDLKKLQMWEPLHTLLNAPSTSDALKVQTLWVVGTAVQNNPAAQLAYLSLNPLPTLLSSLSPSTSTSPKTRSKAVYALSGLLKHNALAVKQLDDIDGWQVLRGALEDSDISVRQKTVFLLNALLIPSSPSPSPSQSQSHIRTVHPNSHAPIASDPSSASTSALTQHALQRSTPPSDASLLDALVSALVEPVPFGADGECERDAGFVEGVVRVLHTYAVQCGGAFSEVQRHALGGWLKAQQGEVERQGEDRWLEAVEEEVEALKGVCGVELGGGWTG
ncbi:nucleotide exchange factors-like protein [Phlebopus sp. FC_14]|nr:nucleotide exchange factors-like protein [Phlebopus sp. FC_14]